MQEDLGPRVRPTWLLTHRPGRENVRAETFRGDVVARTGDTPWPYMYATPSPTERAA